MAPNNRGFNLFRSKSDDNNNSDVECVNTKVPLLIRFYDPEVKGEDASGRTLDEILAWDDITLERCHDYIQMLFPLPEGSVFNFQAPLIDRQVLDAFRRRADLQSRLKESFVRILAFYGFQLEEKEREPTDEGDKRVLEGDSTHGTSIDERMSAADGGKEAGTGTWDELGSTGPLANTAPEVQTHPATLLQQQRLDADNAESACKPANSESPRKMINEEHLLPVLKVVRAANWPTAFRNWAIPLDHNHLRITRILRSLRVLGLEEEADAFYEALWDVFNDRNIRINERSIRYWEKALLNPLHIAPDGEQVPWLRRWVQENKPENVTANGNEKHP